MSILNVNDFLSPLMKAEGDTSRRAIMKALRQSSGKYRASALAKKGHPYSTRNAGGWIPYGDPGMINVQSGEFYLHWKMIPVVHKGNSINSGIANDSDYADQLAKGKKTTIARPLIQKVMPIVEFYRMRNLTRAIRDSLSRYK